MVEWKIEFTKRAQKDAALLKSAGLDKKAKQLIEVLHRDPYDNPPPFEKLQADLKGKYSRRINLQHRIVYEVIPEDELVIVHGMFLHYR